MVVSYNLQCNDEFYATAFQRHFSHHVTYRIFSAIRYLGICILSLCAVALAVKSQWSPALSAFAMVLFIILSRPVERWYRTRQLLKSPFWNESVFTEISDEGLSSVFDKGNTSLTWDSFTHVIRFPNGCLLYQGPQIFFWLPDSALAGNSNPSDAENLIRRNIGDYRELGR